MNTQAPALRVLGIDPGIRKLGFGVVEVRGTRMVPLAHGVVRVERIASLSERLRVLHTELHAIIAEHRPTVAAMEQVFAGKNVRTALLSAEGRGAVRLSLELGALPLFEYAPAMVKRAVVGRGGASKEQVQHMIGVLLALRSAPAEDAADALAVAICHVHRGNGVPGNDRC